MPYPFLLNEVGLGDVHGSLPTVLNAPDSHASLVCQCRALSRNACSCVGQSCNVAGSKSAPFGQTSVCISGSILTPLKKVRSLRGEYSSPNRTGGKSMVWAVLSSK